MRRGVAKRELGVLMEAGDEKRLQEVRELIKLEHTVNTWGVIPVNECIRFIRRSFWN